MRKTLREDVIVRSIPKDELQHETRPVGAPLHQMLPKQPFIKGEMERTNNTEKKINQSNYLYSSYLASYKPVTWSCACVTPMGEKTRP